MPPTTALGTKKMGGSFLLLLSAIALLSSASAHGQSACAQLGVNCNHPSTPQHSTQSNQSSHDNGPSPADALRAQAAAADQKGLEASNRGDWEEAANRFMEALEFAPGSTAIRAHLDRAAMGLADSKYAAHTAALHQRIQDALMAANINALRMSFEAATTRPEVIVSMMASRGSDPTQWHIAAQAVESYPEMKAMPTPRERLDQLGIQLDRLQDQMFAYGYRFAADGLVCVLAPEGCGLDEGRAYEIQDLGIAIAYTRREIEEVKGSPEIASLHYIAAMNALRVPLHKQPQYEVIDSRRAEPTIRPPAPPVQAKTLKDCSPVWESHTTWVLTPKMAAFNGVGLAQYVYQYKPVKYPRATYPAGCGED